MRTLSLLLGLVVAVGLMPSTRAEDKKKDKDMKVEVAKDETVNVELNDKDKKDKQKTECYFKAYRYQFVEGRNYEIAMRSTEIDSWLRLEDAKGKMLAFDDDGGGKSDALIKFKAPKTAEYTIVCTTFNDFATGKFVLTVKDVSDGDANPPKKDEAPKLEKRDR